MSESILQVIAERISGYFLLYKLRITRLIGDQHMASFTHASGLAIVHSKSLANRKTDSRFRSGRQRSSHAKVLKDGLFGSTTQRRDSTVKP